MNSRLSTSFKEHLSKNRFRQSTPLEVELGQAREQLRELRQSLKSRERGSEDAARAAARLREEVVQLQERLRSYDALAERSKHLHEENVALNSQIGDLTAQLERERAERAQWARARIQLLTQFCDGPLSSSAQPPSTLHSNENNNNNTSTTTTNHHQEATPTANNGSSPTTSDVAMLRLLAGAGGMPTTTMHPQTPASPTVSPSQAVHQIAGRFQAKHSPLDHSPLMSPPMHGRYD